MSYNLTALYRMPAAPPVGENTTIVLEYGHKSLGFSSLCIKDKQARNPLSGQVRRSIPVWHGNRTNHEPHIIKEVFGSLCYHNPLSNGLWLQTFGFQSRALTLTGGSPCRKVGGLPYSSPFVMLLQWIQ